MSFCTDHCRTAADVWKAAVRARLFRENAFRPVVVPAAPALTLPETPAIEPPPEPPAIVEPPPVEEAIIESVPDIQPPPPPPESITVRHVIELVAEYFSLSYRDIISDHRGHALVRPRQIAMYVAHRAMLSATYPKLGRAFRRDHTTILHGVRRTAMLIGSGRSDVKAAVGEVMAKLGLPMPQEAPCSLLTRLHWSRWSRDEIEELEDLYVKRGRSLAQIVEALGRTENAVVTKLHKLGYRRPKTRAA